MRNRNLSRVAVATAAVVTTTAVAFAAPASAVADHGPGRGRTQNVLYRPSTDNIPNPERGFEHVATTHYVGDGSSWEPLTDAQLQAWRRLGDTQVNRVWYLDAFAGGADLSRDLLDKVQQDLDVARRNGFTIIARFAYVQGTTYPYAAPYGDAPLPTVLRHIDELTPLLRANTDVISTLQSGFVGLWGEGYYSDHFSDPTTHEVSDAQWALRRAVVQAELAALPANKTVQVRTPQMKQRILGVPTGTQGAVTSAQAYSGTPIARIGVNDDCFVASPDDYGTFLSDPVSLDQDHLAADSRYTLTGGETCGYQPPISDWPNAAAQMQRYHFSYLNRDYFPGTLAAWGAEGIATTERRLGYRFELVSSSVTRATRRTPAEVTVTVLNTGWAAPYDEREAQLVLTGRDGTRHTVSLGSDARRWAPGTATTVRATVTDLPAGTYRAALALPSSDPRAAADPLYAIRTANVGTWQSATGTNDLHQSVVVR